MSNIIREIMNNLGNYDKNIKTKINNIDKACVDSSIPATTARVSQTSRIYINYPIVEKNKLTLCMLRTHEKSICIGILPSHYNELKEKQKQNNLNELENHIINNIGSDDKVSCIIAIIKEDNTSGSSFCRKEKELLDIIIEENNFKPLKRKNKERDINNGNDKWSGEYYYNISGGQQETLKSWEGKEEAIFTSHRGFMSSKIIVDLIKLILLYYMLHIHDIDKIFTNEKIEEYKDKIKKILEKEKFLDKSYYELLKEIPCLNKKNELISPISYKKISIDDFREKNKINISHNVAVCKNIILYCENNKIMFSDYRPGNLFWDFKVCNMRQQDDTIEEYWLKIEESLKLRNEL